MSFSKTKALIILLSMALLLCGFSQSAMAAIRYVKSDSSAADGSGLTWDTAFHTVQAAVNAATSGDEIWVAAGTYNELITLKDRIALYGGFMGAEAGRDERNWATNKTILDGTGINGSVVTAKDLLATDTRIDGFTIQNGSGTDCGYNYCGGGIYCENSSPIISNNTISENKINPKVIESFPSTYNAYGGGICCNNSSPIISNNMISGNTVGNCTSKNPLQQSHGGGIGCLNNSAPVISNNIISGNGCETDGGGIFCGSNSFPIIKNNSISGNKALWSGGGIRCEEGNNRLLVISNNKISGNTAHFDGGGISCEFALPTISNNTIYGNKADNYGGGIRFSSSPTICNNIIAYNTQGIYTTEFIQGTLSYNCVCKNTGGDYADYHGKVSPGATDLRNPDNNLDPSFVDPNNGDFRLQINSPCIDAGNDSAAGVGMMDFNGAPRIHGPHIDIGAYELQYVTVKLSTTAGNTTNSLPIPVTITFDAAVTGFDMNDLVIGNGIASDFRVIDGRHYTVSIKPSSDGAITVDLARGSARDANGNENIAATQLGLLYDGTAPTGSLSINGGNTITYDPATTLSITANDTGSGILQMRFSNDSLTWSEWETYAPSKDWTLGAGIVGTCIVYAEVKDTAGNIAVFSDTIAVKVAIPIISPGAGTYNISNISITCSTTGAEIRYTTDGSEPVETSTLYDSPLILNGSNVTVTAEAFKTGWLSNVPVSVTYTINSNTITYRPGVNSQANLANLLQTAQNFENDLAVQFNSATLWLGKGKTGKLSDLWFCYPNLIGYGTGQIRKNTQIVRAKLVLTVKGFKGNPYLTHKINLYQISDPENFGAPYFGESGLRNGLDYQYRDHRPGRNIKWTNNDKNGDGNANIGDLISGNTPVDTYEVIPAYFTEEKYTQIRLDVTESIKSWLSDSANQGWFLSGDAADRWSFDDGVEFYGITDSIIANRPKLEVTYLDTNVDNNPPGKVTDLKATCTSDQVGLSWNNPTDNDFMGVLILRKAGLIPADPTDGVAVYDQQGTIGSTTTYTDTGLTNDQTYYYAVFTYDNLRNYSRGISIKAIPTAGGRAPDAPYGLIVSLNGNALTFSWTDQSGNEKWFLLEQQKGSGDFVTVACPAANQQSFTATLDNPNFNLTPNTGYTYRISAVNDYGASIPSATYSRNTGVI